MTNQSPRILLAEDGKTNQIFILSFLKKAGYQVDIAENGYEALDLISRNTYNLVLMDVQMPGLNGIETTSRLRGMDSVNAEIPVIAMTAHSGDNACDEYCALGMNGYIAKPISKTDLLKTVQEHLAARIPPSRGEAETSPSSDPAPSLDCDTAPDIDEQKLSEVLSTIRPASLERIIGCFMQEMSAKTHRLTQAQANQDLAEMASEAHDIGSTAGSFGGARVMTLARTLEATAKNKEMKKSLDLAQSLNEATTALLSEVRKRF